MHTYVSKMYGYDMQEATFSFQCVLLTFPLSPGWKYPWLSPRWEAAGYTAVQFCLAGCRFVGQNTFPGVQQSLIILGLWWFIQVGRGSAHGPLFGVIFYHWHNVELLTHYKSKNQADFLVRFIIGMKFSTAELCMLSTSHGTLCKVDTQEIVYK